MKKHKKLFIALIILAVSLLLGGIFIYFFLFKGASKEQSILYVKDHNLMVYSENNKEPILIDSSFYDDYLKANFSLDSTYIAYINDEELYVYNSYTKTKKHITSDDSINEFVFSNNNKYLVYFTNEYIYSYDLTKDVMQKIASLNEGEESFHILTYDNKVYYGIMNEEDYLQSFYFYDFKNGKLEKIAANITGYSANEDDNKILYYIGDSTNNTENVYIYDAKKNQSTKILSNIHDSYLLHNDDYTKFVFLKDSSEKVEIIIDDEKDNDPVTTIKEEKLCTYYDYLNDYCTYEQYWYAEYYTVTTKASKKDINDEIRDFVNNEKLYDLYLYENGKETLIEKNVDYIDSSNEDYSVVVFYKYDLSETRKISEFKSYEDFKKYYDSLYSAYVKKINKDAIKISTGALKFSYYQILIGENDNVYYVSENNKDLYYFNNGSSENIASGDYIMLYGNSKYGMMYEVTNDEKTDLYVYDGTSTKIASSISGAVYDHDNKVIHIYNNCNDHACDYSKYDGSLKPVFEDIAGINNLDNNKYYVFKNYSTTNETFDIHYYNGKNLINIAYDVSVNLIYINY